MARLAHEIPKPKDHQAFERNCAILFRAELGDPGAQTFGRNGQGQGGIDVVGRRGGRSRHRVGIQCRLITRRDKEEKVLEDCLAAIDLGLGLEEVIFATTAPDDVEATKLAYRVENELRQRGHDVKVTIYGWGQLQDLIAQHPAAYRAFFPAAVADASTDAGSPRRSGGGPSAGGIDFLPRLHGRLVRRRELSDLSQAFARGARIIALLGSGGAGKTSLVRLWRGGTEEPVLSASPVITWSFYNQGVAGSLFDARPMFASLLRQLALPVDEGEGAAALVGVLADHLSERSVTVILDGLEVIQQDADGPDRGRALDPALRDFLLRMSRRNAGTLVVTSRLPLPEADPRDTIQVEGLAEDDALELMRANGVRGSVDVLRTVIGVLMGHALSVATISRLMEERWHGEAAFAPDAFAELLEGLRRQDLAAKIQRVFASMEEALRLHAPVELAVLQALSVFDRPVSGELASQTTFPAFPELLDATGRRRALPALLDKGLIHLAPAADGPGFELHPLLRSYFSGRLMATRPAAYRDAHARLFDRFRNRAERDACESRLRLERSPQATLPFSLFEHGYRAIPHGVAAGRAQEARELWDRTVHLGDKGAQSLTAAHEAELAAIRALLSIEAAGDGGPASAKLADLLNERFYAEKALGLLNAAQETSRQAVEQAAGARDFREASLMGSNRAQILLHLARFQDADLVVEEAADFARRVGVGRADEPDLLLNLSSFRVVSSVALDHEQDARRLGELLRREHTSAAAGGGLGPMSLLRCAEAAHALADLDMLRWCAERMAEHPGLGKQHVQHGYLALVQAWLAMGEGEDCEDEVARFFAAAEASRTEQAVVRALALRALRFIRFLPDRAPRALEAAVDRAQSSQMVATEMELVLLGLRTLSTTHELNARLRARYEAVARSVDYPFVSRRVEELLASEPRHRRVGHGAR